MTRNVRLNNMKIKAQRRELLYEAVMIDLVRIGALPKETVEGLLGATIPDTLLDLPAKAVGSASGDAGSIEV